MSTVQTEAGPSADAIAPFQVDWATGTPAQALIACSLCDISFDDDDSFLEHCCIVHSAPSKPLCLCPECSPGEAHEATETMPLFAALPTPTEYYMASAVAESIPSGSSTEHMQAGPSYATGAVPAQRAIHPMNSNPVVLPDDGMDENNLPPFMGKIEAGVYTKTNGTVQWLVKRARPKPMDFNNSRLVSPSTGREFRDVPFLPFLIPSTVPAWRILYWDRLAAEQGIRLTNHDLVDRMSSDDQPLTLKQAQTKANMLSMRVQRYTPALGQLPMSEKKNTAFPSEQSMRTIEGLMVLQGELNTWWLPSHFTREGPWELYQPQVHPGYKGPDGNRSALRLGIFGTGGSYLLEERFGLSERLKELADAILFLEMKAEQAGLEAEDKYVSLSTLMSGAKDEAAWFREEFARWRKGGYEDVPSIEAIRTALENATDGSVVQAIVGGDMRAVTSLQDTQMVDGVHSSARSSKEACPEGKRIILIGMSGDEWS